MRLRLRERLEEQVHSSSSELKAVHARVCESVYPQECLAKLLVFNRLDVQLQRKIVQEMFERRVGAGEILIKEGDTGLAATELFVVKSGKFEVIKARVNDASVQALIDLRVL